MATYYVRTDGNDGNAGTGPAAANAWLTVGKALGAAGIASGDTVYIAPGTYREQVTVAMTSAVAETFVVGDVSASQFSDLQGGDVILTSYTTNDRTVPLTGVTMSTNARDFLTFQHIIFVAADASGGAFIVASGSVQIKLYKCTFITSVRSNNTVAVNATVDVGSFITFDSCIFIPIAAGFITVTLPTSAVADYDCEVVVKNCLVTAGTGMLISASGALAFKGGGVKVYNCSMFLTSSASAVNCFGANVASSAGNQTEVYNNLMVGGLSATTLGQLVEDYNFIVASTTRTNVTAGGNSIATSTTLSYAWLLSFGQEFLNGKVPVPAGMPMLNSPFLGFGNDAAVGVQTVDLYGTPRPSGGLSALKAIGAMELPNTFVKETGTVRTGSNAISITGPGVQDFQLPVDAGAMTAQVYVRWDATYAGTKPQMIVFNGEECGVATATVTATGSSGAWELVSLNFTPTRAGIVTIRFQSNDTNGGGKMFVDDFSTP